MATPPPPTPDQDIAQLVRSAEAERERLLAALREVPAFRALETLQEMLEAYAALGAPGSATPADVVIARTGHRSTVARRLVAVRRYLLATGGPAKVRELLAALEAEGVPMTMDKPVAVLSSQLCSSPLFTNTPGLGYSLTEWGGVFAPRRSAPGQAAPHAVSQGLDGSPAASASVPVAEAWQHG